MKGAYKAPRARAGSKRKARKKLNFRGPTKDLNLIFLIFRWAKIFTDWISCNGTGAEADLGGELPSRGTQNKLCKNNFFLKLFQWEGNFSNLNETLNSKSHCQRHPVQGNT